MSRRIDYNSPAVMAEARRKLAEMYAAEDTAGRTYIGRKLDYTGKPQNIRRSVRRLVQFTVKEGEETSLNRFFKSYTVKPNSEVESFREFLQSEANPYLGIEPPYSITGLARIQARVMFVVERSEGGYAYYDTFVTWISPGAFQNMREGITAFLERVYLLYYDPAEMEKLDMVGYPGLDAIAFSGEGVEQLLSLPKYEGLMAPREPLDNYGVFLHSTKSAFVDGERLPMAAPSVTGRPFPSRPKGRRKEMIQYINRSYAARKREGSL